jgi:hypothetical protein
MKNIFKNQISVESLFGNEIASEKLVLQGMKDLEKEFKASFIKEQESKLKQENLMKTIHGPLMEKLDSPETRRAVQGLKQLENANAREKLALPKMERMEDRIFPGSIGATRVPAYNYQWQWNVQNIALTLSKC